MKKNLFAVLFLTFLACASSDHSAENESASPSEEGGRPSQNEGPLDSSQGIMPLGDMAWRCEIQVGEKTYEAFGKNKSTAEKKVKRECAVQSGPRSCTKAKCRQNN